MAIPGGEGGSITFPAARRARKGRGGAAAARGSGLALRGAARGCAAGRVRRGSTGPAAGLAGWGGGRRDSLMLCRKESRF